MLRARKRRPTDVPVKILEPSHGWSFPRLDRLWEYRQLLYFLVWRDVKVRYKQTMLGVLWVVLQPVVTIVVFGVLFGQLLGVPSEGVPYPVFVFSALLPWNYFASSLNKASISLVGNASLITKVYFPRLIIPISGVLSGLVDFAVSFLILVALMAYYRIPPGRAVLLLPPFLLLAMLTALGFSLWLSALNVRFRDVNYLIPFLVQTWMYLTPVIYGSALVPARFRSLLGLNPMTGVVEGFRWALLGQHLTYAQAPDSLIIASLGIAMIVLVSGLMFFRRTETTFADII